MQLVILLIVVSLSAYMADREMMWKILTNVSLNLIFKN